MTSRLNTSRPYGKITPPWDDHQFSSPAYYEQDGRYYDAHYQELIPGGNPKPAPSAPVRAAPPAPVVERQPAGATSKPEPERIDVSLLVAQADTMPWAKFRSQARKVLGPTCPPDKEGMKAALQRALEAVHEREERRTPGKAQVEAVVAEVANAPAAAPASVGVDLAAWGMGQKEYLFGEVQKAIRTQFAKQVTERRDAVDFLIEQRIIAAANARNDV